MTTLKMHSPNLVDDNIAKIATLFPNCITEKPKTDEQGNPVKDKDGNIILETAIDFDQLKQELSHHLIDGNQERYRLDWVGKREAILTANSPIAKTLRPYRDESVDFDNTGNLFIEGDNLEALKLLQESYLGEVKMIYIDPPYNTGNDFIYNDDFSEDTDSFFARSGQVDDNGNRLIANTESNGRFHSDWLSMMYSRLKLARNLLSDDGVIFISIDDNEVHNLRKICDEIFGAGNFVAEIVWQRKRGRDNSAKWFSKSHEYLLVISKNKIDFKVNLLDLDENTLKAYKNPDNDPRGDYRMLATWARGTQGGVKYDFTSKNGQYFSERLWLFSKENLQKLDEENKLIIKGDNIYRKLFLTENKGKIPETIWSDVSNGANASDEIKSIFDRKIVFDTPKPIPYIQEMIKIATSDSGIILDFFAGSATTAHAVMQLNSEDGGNRQFIMVQLPEKTDEKSEAFKAGFKTISEISKERIRRAGAKIKAENVGKDGIDTLDTGFRVLKIDTSNMADIYYRPDDYRQDLLDGLVDTVKADRSDEDLLFGFMLDMGVALSLPIERTNIGGHTVYQVGGNSLVASLDYIDAQMIDDIARLAPIKFVTSERAIATDSDKTNIIERFKQLSPHTDVRFI